MSTEQIKQMTDANQAIASNPRVSAWVSANAGTGKTTVLVNRVLRLLLHRDAAGDAYTRPEKILCLTYTKAAAAEMENRLFAILAHWAVVSERELAGALKDLRGEPASPRDMARARRLFATTLDTRGGLKIHTIHAFCERLLHRFPLEAGIQADFKVLEDQERRDLREKAIDDVLRRAAAEEGEPLGQALTEVVAVSAEDSFRSLIEVALGRQEDIRALHRLNDAFVTLGQSERHGIIAAFGESANRSEADVLNDMAQALSDAQIDTFLAGISAEKATEKNLLSALARAKAAGAPESRALAFREAFLIQAGTPRKTLLTKLVAAEHPEFLEELHDAQDKVAALAREQAALNIASATGALLTLADEIIARYERRKAARAGLDYDDLIEKSVRLLSGSRAAAWVLYKLDYGIDHILVDEAQDTSPVQWRVIDALAGEFFAGESAQETDRTLFAVGDEKQSIYSFQGADPASFAEHGRKFRTLAEAAGRQWERVPLTVSFRSTEPVLKAVDEVFDHEGARDGVVWEGAQIVHQAVRAGQAGLVELWPVEEPVDHTPAHAMRPHEEEAAETHARDALVEKIADTIKHWLGSGERLDAQNRAMRPGDILLLVRNRDEFVGKLIRALKARGIPVAGADRMKLGEQLAVMDLMAVGDFVLLPDDDLTLACVLKSPLFGFDDDDLFDLAFERTGPLWNALRDKAKKDERYGAAAARLSQWLKSADTAPPYEFFAGLLEERQMRMRLTLIARLGADAGDAIDEFLNLALDYERLSHPSLQGFLDWMRRAQAEVKRDMEQERDEVRIMTVHGAKGLEANVVILPDTCRTPSGGGNRPKLLPLPRASAPPDVQDHLVWVPPGTMELGEIADAKEERKEKDREEYNRLLYVAMTRARDRLYVCGWKGAKKIPDTCWHKLVSAGLEGLARPARGALGQDVLRYESSQDPKLEVEAGETPQRPEPVPLPRWAKEDAAPEASPALPLTPSAISSAGEPGEGELPEQDVVPPLERADASRFLRGNLVHALLQHLPEIDADKRAQTARRYVAAKGKELAGKDREDIVAETLAILEGGEFAPLFGPRSQAEAPVAARISRAGKPALEFNGQIDRIVELENEVLIVDYKTNRPPPKRAQDVAPLYRRQLAAYRQALRRIYPGKKVRAALLWTDGPHIMAMPDELLDEAEADIMKL